MIRRVFLARVGVLQSLLLLLVLPPGSASAQKEKALKTENVFLITTDGLRWQELFTGADADLIAHEKFTRNPQALKKEYWRATPEARREALMPFFWNVIAEKGQIYGNRNLGCEVDVTNNMWFSYPGYNEIFTGHADDERIHSNDKVPNPNVTVLEFVNQQDGFQGKVAATATWDVFPFIINAERSGIRVEAGHPDATTQELALKILKEDAPRLLYVSYGNTDHSAHEEEYDVYLDSAHTVDGYIRDLWEYAQSTPQYQGKTTFIITTDHGRGLGKEWTSHGRKIAHSNEMWIAVLGPDTPARGEIASGHYTQSQVARTVAAFLDLEYAGKPEAGRLLESSMEH
ncbi:MAG TPA: AP protein [Isosphaeraceae bacterium]|nr:AP protein [Isosphaeraceae bacterium]